MSGRRLALVLACTSLAACGPRPRLPLGPPPEYEEPLFDSSERSPPAAGEAGAPLGPETDASGDDGGASEGAP